MLVIFRSQLIVQDKTQQKIRINVHLFSSRNTSHGLHAIIIKNISMMVMQSRNEEDVDEKTNVLHVVDDFNQLVR